MTQRGGGGAKGRTLSVSLREAGSCVEGANEKETVENCERRGGADRLYTGQLCLFFMRNEPKERQRKECSCFEACS